MAKRKRLKRAPGDVTDYGAAPLYPVGKDAHGNPVFRRDTPSKDLITLKNFDQTQGNARHAVNETPNMVLKLFRAEMITRTGRDVAEKLQLDYEESGQRPDVGSSYEPRQGGGVREMTDAEAKAYKRYTKAVQAVGPVYGDVLMSIVLHDYFPTPNDIKRLNIGLKRLAAHYGHL